MRFIVHLNLAFLIELDQSFGKSDEILHLSGNAHRCPKLSQWRQCATCIFNNVKQIQNTDICSWSWKFKWFLRYASQHSTWNLAWKMFDISIAGFCSVRKKLCRENKGFAAQPILTHTTSELPYPFLPLRCHLSTAERHTTDTHLLAGFSPPAGTRLHCSYIGISCFSFTWHFSNRRSVKLFVGLFWFWLVGSFWFWFGLVLIYFFHYLTRDTCNCSIM